MKTLLFYVVTICPSAVHPVGCYYFTNSNNYQSSISSEWNVDAECPRRYSKVFVYYNCVFTSTEKSNFVAVWNLVGGGTCITGNTVTILLSIKILPLTPILRSAFSTNCNSICRKWKSDHCIKVTGTQFHSNDCNSIGTAKIIRKIGTTCHCRKNHFFRRIVQIIYTASWQVTI